MPFARPYYMGVIRVKVGSYFRRFALKISTLPLTRPLMRGKYRLRQCAGFEQGETEDNGIGCKGEYRAVQIVRYYHAVYQNRVNADAYHNEEALKTDSEQGF